VAAVGEEITRLTHFEERHRRLFARLLLVVAATALIDVLATVAIYFLERHAHMTEVKTFGDALFFTTTQLLTVSSSLKNPLTGWGRVVDVLLEGWAVLVVAGSAGAVAAFFQTGDA
jgi:ion channel